MMADHRDHEAAPSATATAADLSNSSAGKEEGGHKEHSGQSQKSGGSSGSGGDDGDAKTIAAQEAADDKDLYALLNCSQHASPEQIKTEFMLLAKKHHPDRQVPATLETTQGAETSNPNVARPPPASESKAVHDTTERGTHVPISFTRLSRAYCILSDPSLRKQYDDWRAAGLNISFTQWQSAQMSSRLHFAMSTKKPLQLEEKQDQGKHGDEPSTKRPHTTVAAPSASATLQAFRQGQSPDAALRNFRGW
ncbi:hypothetical protein PTSG_05282 [Salpingoeca rosetta]|uniref:J domain-containing protein n=1 Tax=Salpingoeca rosetta (strain ATCC 50818 / BSB-021) TaxID=946362 RepID=F2UA00_SALR5|nr:uncharacterized protein PTSG_05282 [Salpingoeca rosetta]EGD73575.1 hypothetical protein PTSG_05282 [Salpingoeca rosetta]|eukprot:XP_004993857.1 hypothetical protein PTSG_05282 [Salpingoeca rosetta]